MAKSLARKVYLELVRLYPDTEQWRDGETIEGIQVQYAPYSYKAFKGSPIGKAIAEVEAEEKRYNRDR